MALKPPRTHQGDLEHLPTALAPLTEERRWVNWRWVPRTDAKGKVKWTKPPYRPRNPNVKASSDDPDTWADYNLAVRRVRDGDAVGIGYALLDSNIAAVDLDKCCQRDAEARKTEIDPWAREVREEANGAYVEVTVSGTGLRLIGLGKGTELQRRFSLKNGAGIELFRRTTRYITISGLKLRSCTCTELSPIDNLLDSLCARYEEQARDKAERGTARSDSDYDRIIREGVPNPERSQAFGAVVWHLAARGWSAEQIEAELRRYPHGIAAKYGKRLGEEVRRCFDDWRRAREAEAGQEAKKELVLVNAADIIPRSMDWLWKGHLLRGAQELFTGMKGMAKSQAQCSLVACVTTGRDWPNGERGCEPGNVIMVVAEDALDQVVVPRLILAGADLNRVKFLKAIRQDDKKRMFMLGEDIEHLERAIRGIGNVALVTLDPITAFMGKINSSSPTDVRGQLGPLAQLAEETNVAVSTITHPPKQGTQHAIDHFIGSQAFIAAARIGHLCVPEMKVNDSGVAVPTGSKLFTMVASNHRHMPTLRYYVDDEQAIPMPKGLERVERLRFMANLPTAVKVCWLGEVDITADEALAAAAHKAPQKLEEAVAFLRQMLKEGPVSQAEVAKTGKERGFSEDQLNRAKTRLGVVSQKAGLSGGWTWRLPSEAERDDE